MTDKDFEAQLTELYGTFTVAGITFDAGTILRKLDPIAFQVFKADEESMYEEANDADEEV